MELDVDRKIVGEYILVKSDRMLITVCGQRQRQLALWDDGQASPASAHLSLLQRGGRGDRSKD